MIIECPHCGTRFRLDERQLSGGRSMLKCARCRRVFAAPGHASPTRPRPQSPPAEPNLSFDFDDDDEWRAPELTSEDVPEDGFLLNEPVAGPPRAKPRRRAVAPEQTALRFEPDAEEAFDAAGEAVDGDAAAGDGRGAGGAPRIDADDRDEDAAAAPARRAPAAPPAARRRAAAVEADRAGGIGVRAVFVFLTIVVGAYGALTWTLLDDPGWAQRLTQGLPVVGPTLRERSAADVVDLVDVEGRYERTKDGRAVYVITGRAHNRSDESLRKVEIEAVLYDGAARQIDQQVTACGNPLEAKIRELSVHQVSILRSIRPPASFRVQPGASCPFASIFVDVPERAASFSTEVRRAQRTT